MFEAKFSQGVEEALLAGEVEESISEEKAGSAAKLGQEEDEASSDEMHGRASQLERVLSGQS